MNFKNNKGSITLFVLVGLLFMASVLMLLYAFTVNKSKIVKEQYNIISDIYSRKDGDANAYDRAYTYLRGQNKQTATKMVQNTSVIELENTFKGNLSNYRIYGNGVNQEGNNLPAEYQEVEYLESTGTQYIDTGYIMKNTTTFECMAAFMEEKKFWHFGAIYLENSQYYRAHFGGGNNSDITLYDSSGNMISIKYDSNWHIFKFSPENSTLDETNRLTAALNYPQISMYLFKRNSNFQTAEVEAISRIKYTKIWESDICVMNMIPCYRISDNVAGMYDVVNGVFYTNAGTGKFVVGPEAGKVVGDLVIEPNNQNYGKYKISIKSSDEAGESVTKDIYLNEPLEYEEYIDFKTGKVVRRDGTEEFINLPEIQTYEDYTKIEVITGNSPSKIEVEYKKYKLIRILPLGYKQLEYIESTGTQYIDTGVKSNSNIKLDGEFYGEYSDVCWYGGRNLNYIGIYNYNGRFDWLYYNGTGNSIVVNPDTNEWHTVSHSKKLYIDDELIYEYGDVEYTTDYNIYIFAGNNSNVNWSNSSIRIKIIKIYENNIIIRNFIPAQRDSDGAIGLYDSVNDVFYENAGTGEFVAGPVV